MRNQSTYFELKHGVFICEACAGWHNQIFPYNKHYLKEIYTEVWDPYQLKVLSIASNEEWFKLCQSYRMEQQGIAVKYKSVVAKWHKKSLAHRANGMPYNAPKPASAHH